MTLRVLIASLLLSTTVALPAIAGFVIVEVDPNSTEQVSSGAGIVPVPSTNFGDAKLLSTQFAETSDTDLDIMRWSNAICSELNCGSISEDQAGQLLSEFRRSEERQLAQNEKLVSRIFDSFNLLLAVGALAVAIMKARPNKSAEA